MNLFALVVKLSKMQVKDTHIFREFYKSNIYQTNEDNRNPHFAGRKRTINNNDEFGFFQMFHGPGKEMKNLLKTILEMALDSQALYEFMQNAVDAKSSDFLMFHHHAKQNDQDYLIVLNNGLPFDLKGVLSILDIGASTKFGDAETIGQFGVGFKLAHRLVGEDAGLEELIEQNKGPILFSWANSELISLANPEENIISCDPQLEGMGDNAVCVSDYPWLFKILYTNFPCLPSEAIIDAKARNTSDTFTLEEVSIIKEVAEICVTKKVGSSDFNQGTLLVIPLHKKKIHEVTQNATADGLPIAAAIINNRKGHQTLERVMLNEHQLEVAKVEFESFRIDVAELKKVETQDDQKLLRGIPKIEIDLCYSDPFATEDPFKNKPQFYLYFPMTEERHGFRFALHCNAFSFTSARTALQENTQRNKLLFRLFADNLYEKLLQYSTTNQDKFFKIYVSILLSEKGINGSGWKANRGWLEKDFWQPLMDVINQFIPLMDNDSSPMVNSGDNVIIKNSRLPIERWSGVKESYFYWNAKDFPLLCLHAKDKLLLSTKSIADVLMQRDSIPLINLWLSESSDNSDDFLRECNELLPLQFEEKEKLIFWTNFKQLKIWNFSGEYFSAEELSNLEDNRYIIQYGALLSFIPLLERAGFIVSKQSIENYANFHYEFRRRVHGGYLTYLYKHEELNKLLSSRFSVPHLFNCEEKKSIFLAILKAIDAGVNNKSDKVKAFKELALFANKNDDVKPLKELIGTGAVPDLLKNWRIREDESADLNLGDYTSEDIDHVYENVVVPNWRAIAVQTNTSEPQLEKLFAYLDKCFAERRGLPTLESSEIHFSETGYVLPGDPFFYHENLEEVSADNYVTLSCAISKIGLGHLPLRSLLPFYKRPPFRLSSSNNLVFILPEEGIAFNLSEAKIFLHFALKLYPDFFRKYSFVKKEDSFILSSRQPAITQFSTNKDSIIDYVGNYHSDILVPIPREFNEIVGDKVLHEEGLRKRLIFDLAISNEAAVMALITIISEDGNDSSQMEIIKKLPTIDIEKNIEKDSLHYLILKLCFSLTVVNRISTLENQIGIIKEGVFTPLNKILNRGSDNLIVEGVEFSIAEILGGDDNSINNLLTKASINWEALEIGTKSDVEDAIGIKVARSKMDVLGELRQKINNEIVDGIQLAFILLMSKQDVKILAGFTVKTLSGNKQIKDSTFYLNNEINNAFIPHENLLRPEYYSSSVKLKLDVYNQFEIGDTTIVLKPYLNRDELELPGIKAISTPASQNAFYNYLFKLWKENNTPERIKYHGQINKWHSLIGHEVENWVLVDELANADEKVPYDSLALENIQEKEMDCFLSALGANGDNSPIVEVRKYFFGLGGSLQFQRSLNSKQVRSTLNWLGQKEIVVQNKDLIPFYEEKVIPANSDLPSLPCFFPAKDGLMILNNVKSAFFLSKTALDIADKKGFKPQQISNAGLAPIIASIGCLSNLFQRLDKDLKKISISWSEVDLELLRSNSEEWTHPVYIEWKKEVPNLAIFMNKGRIPRRHTVNGNLLEKFSDGDIANNNNKTVFYVNNTLSPNSIIDLLIQVCPEHNADWELLRSNYNAQTKEVEALIAKAYARPETRQAIDSLLKDIKISEERTEKANLVKDSKSFYTLKWFQDLLDLVKQQEKKVGTPDVVFSKCILVAGRTDIYYLSDSDRIIPTNLETFDTINAKITYKKSDGNDGEYETAIEASNKALKLEVRFPEGLPKYINDSNIVTVKLTFTRQVDLIQALKTGFSQLNLLPETNLKETLSANIRFLFGPPGTGKTTTLAKRIIQRIGTVDGPIVVLTPTNKAADVLARKIIDLQKGLAPNWLIRMGNCTNPVLLDAEIVKTEKETVIGSHTKAVIITTIHRFQYQKVLVSASSTDKVRLCDCPWSQVVFDESSMIPLAYITCAIQQRQQKKINTEFVVAGDPLQIPPVFDLIGDDLEEDWQETLQGQNIYTMLGINSFNVEDQRKIPVYGENNFIENLTMQHRSVPSIGTLFSKFQYGGRVRHSRGTADNKRTDIPRKLPEYFSSTLGFRPITVIRYPVQYGQTIFNPKKLNRSPLHIYSALVISELVKRLRYEIEKEQMDAWSLGIVSPYRAQADIIGKMIEGHDRNSERLIITTDTVHGFQGDENNMVFAIFNPSSANAFFSRFLKKEYIINVAISRAEDYLVLFIPDERTFGIDNLSLFQNLLHLIHELPQDQVAYLDAADIEKEIMPSDGYFEENCRTTAHQNVNVYGKPHRPFVIRHSDNAIDVHWENADVFIK